MVLATLSARCARESEPRWKWSGQEGRHGRIQALDVVPLLSLVRARRVLPRLLVALI